MIYKLIAVMAFVYLILSYIFGVLQGYFDSLTGGQAASLITAATSPFSSPTALWNMITWNFPDVFPGDFIYFKYLLFSPLALVMAFYLGQLAINYIRGIATSSS